MSDSHRCESESAQSPPMLSRGQRALLAAQEAVFLRERKRSSAAVRSSLGKLSLPTVTYFFISEEEDNVYAEADFHPSLQAAFDLAYYLRYDEGVPGGCLPHFPLRHVGETDRGVNAIEAVHDCISTLRAESYEFVLAWHVIGESEVHLDHSRNSDSEAQREFLQAVVNETEMMLL